MKITREWLMRYKGKMWNRQQIRALGLKYPLYSGWVDDVIGKEITNLSRDKFENSQTIMQLKLAGDAIDYSVYYTVPDGKGSFKGRHLKKSEVGTFPDE